jgi:hypothetical protein
MKLKTIIKEDEGSIRDLMARFVNANKKNSKRAHDKWMGMVAARLIDLGFVGRIRKQILIALDTVVSQKQFDTLIAKYKLFGDYADSFRPTEKFKLVLEIPFTTTDNKDQKLRRLKYDLSINNIEVEALQGINVAELDKGVLDYQAVVYISTTLTRSELNSILEPDYKIAKMQRLDQKPAEDDA